MGSRAWAAIMGGGPAHPARAPGQGMRAARSGVGWRGAGWHKGGLALYATRVRMRMPLAFEAPTVR